MLLLGQLPHICFVSLQWNCLNFQLLSQFVIWMQVVCDENATGENTSSGVVFHRSCRRKWYWTPLFQLLLLSALWLFDLTHGSFGLKAPIAQCSTRCVLYTEGRSCLCLRIGETVACEENSERERYQRSWWNYSKIKRCQARVRRQQRPMRKLLLLLISIM